MTKKWPLRYETHVKNSARAKNRAFLSKIKLRTAKKK